MPHILKIEKEAPYFFCFLWSEVSWLVVTFFMTANFKVCKSNKIQLSAGVPIKPMLAAISRGPRDALRQLGGGAFLAEWKYDGMRAQIHILPDGTAKIFSRNCEDRTAAFADAAEQVREAAIGGAKSLILDSEIVAVDRRALPAVRLRAFQELASRPRGSTALADQQQRQQQQQGRRGKQSGEASVIAPPPIASTAASASLVQICVFAFDLLEADGESLLGLPLAERRRRLAAALPGMQPGLVQLAQGREVGGKDVAEALAAVTASAATSNGGGTLKGTGGDPGSDRDKKAAGKRAKIEDEDEEEAAEPSAGEEESGDEQPSVDRTAPAAAAAATSAAPMVPLELELTSWLLEACEAGAEGLMLKSLSNAYEPSRRSNSWVKLKKDYCEGLHDTLDLVPIGAWWGNGRKAGWFSPFLMACWDPEEGALQSVCRCMSGFSDAFYKEATARSALLSEFLFS
jgi:DNA ligase 1